MKHMSLIGFGAAIAVFGVAAPVVAGRVMRAPQAHAEMNVPSGGERAEECKRDGRQTHWKHPLAAHRDARDHGAPEDGERDDDRD